MASFKTIAASYANRSKEMLDELAVLQSEGLGGSLRAKHLELGSSLYALYAAFLGSFSGRR